MSAGLWMLAGFAGWILAGYVVALWLGRGIARADRRHQARVLAAARRQARR